VGRWGLFDIGEVHTMIILEEDSTRDTIGGVFLMFEQGTWDKVSLRIHCSN
jgi:hypothetical protein